MYAEGRKWERNVCGRCVAGVCEGGSWVYERVCYRLMKGCVVG